MSPHPFIQECEARGCYFQSVIPHRSYDRYLFLRGDITFHVAFNGQGYALTVKRLKKVLFNHITFSLAKEEMLHHLLTLSV